MLPTWGDHLLFGYRIVNKMESILQNPGLQHIVEKSLNYLDKKSIFQFRLVNSDCKRIADCPRLYLKKLSDENPSEALIEEWEPYLEKIPSEDIKQRLTMELFKMYAQNCAKKPLELVDDLAIGKKKEDIGLVTFIIGNSNPKSLTDKIWFWSMKHLGMVTLSILDWCKRQREQLSLE